MCGGSGVPFRPCRPNSRRCPPSIGLATGQRVQGELIGRRSYDREIATCAFADGHDLGMILVGQGLCVRRRF